MVCTLPLFFTETGVEVCFWEDRFLTPFDFDWEIDFRAIISDPSLKKVHKVSVKASVELP